MMEPTRKFRQSGNWTDGLEPDANQSRSDSLRYTRPRAAEKSGYPLEENLPVFLGGSEEENYAAELQDNTAYDEPERDAWPSEAALRQNALQQQHDRQQGHRQQNDWQQSEWQPDDWQHSGYQQDPWEQGNWEAQRRRRSTARRVIKFGLVAAALTGAVFAAFTLQSKHALIADASASLASVLPALPGISSVAPAVPQITKAAVAPVQTPPGSAEALSRQAITSAFQTALQTQPSLQQPLPVVQSPPIVPAPEPAARSIDPDELAALLKRAQSMMDIGDIASARLLLERAAGAHEAKAALLLAQTYDPAVIGATDLRSVTADPASARLWYQKAAEFGSEEARNRLAQMTN